MDNHANRVRTPPRKLSKLAADIVETYEQLGGINHLGHCPLPSTHAVIEIAAELKEILFPGFRRRQNLHRGNVAQRVESLLQDVFAKLATQVSRALRHEAQSTGETTSFTDFSAAGEQLSLQFLEQFPRLREELSLDAKAAFEGDPAARNVDEIIFCYPGLEAITNHRMAHRLFQLGVPMIPRMLSEWSHRETGIDIHPGAKIGPSFFIDHGTGVVIGETCEIADNVRLYQGVTLGALNFPKDERGRVIRGQKRHPTIERNVVIYSNANILGGTTVVGENSIIGASVSLTKSIPPNTLVTVETPSLRFRNTIRRSA